MNRLRQVARQVCTFLLLWPLRRDFWWFEWKRFLAVARFEPTTFQSNTWQIWPQDHGVLHSNRFFVNMHYSLHLSINFRLSIFLDNFHRPLIATLTNIDPFKRFHSHLAKANLKLLGSFLGQILYFNLNNFCVKVIFMKTHTQFCYNFTYCGIVLNQFEKCNSFRLR